MNPNGILMITITILVALTTMGVWGILFALVRSHGVAGAERNGVIRALSEECGEADAMLSPSAAKAMNGHALRSALSPKSEKIQKMLTANLHILDVYFVKYTEGRLAAYQAALAASETGLSFPIDKFLADSKPVITTAEVSSGSGSVAHDLKARVEAMPVTVAPVIEKEEPEEPPAIDLRTGIITVSKEELIQVKPSAPAPVKKPAAKPSADETKVPAQMIRKAPVPEQKKKPEPPASVSKATVEAEEIFDFEKEISAKVIQMTRPADPKPVPMEKTMRWDKSELSGFAGKPEAIVVEGAESHVKGAPSAQAKKSGAQEVVPQTDAKAEEPMISGEDIENTLDSFFGLGDR
jgi:hypothetical protein